MQTPECPSCRTAMEDGFMIDRGDHNAPAVSRWAAGEPERSFWTGLKLKGKLVLPAVTYRCPRCGLLQSYARQA